jgi:hypothetical protein
MLPIGSVAIDKTMACSLAPQRKSANIIDCGGWWNSSTPFPLGPDSYGNPTANSHTAGAQPLPVVGSGSASLLIVTGFPVFRHPICAHDLILSGPNCSERIPFHPRRTSDARRGGRWRGGLEWILSVYCY